MVNERYKEKVRLLSERVVSAQRPIRILDAIKWDDSIEESFFKSKCKVLPKVDADYYSRIPLGFDVDLKKKEFEEISADIRRQLGADDSLGDLLARTAAQYHDVLDLLGARASKRFWDLSRKLYGSPKDHLNGDTNTVASLGRVLYGILGKLEEKDLGPSHPEDIDAETAVGILSERMKRYFQDDTVRVIVSDGIVADAAAGGELLKIRRGARFSIRDVNLLEVHEGWVHLGTNQSGRAQTTAKWLSKGPPRCVPTQEGLAVVMEIITLSSYPNRARQINHRVVGIDMAEEGADFLQLFRFFADEGYSEREAYQLAMRICRGGLVSGGAPFTKDIAYCRGFIENYNFIRTAIRAGRPQLVPFLFVGKVHVDDIPLLYRMHLEGVVDPPKCLPPQFADLNGLAIWMSFSSFLNQVDLRKVQEHYGELFAKHL